jgi:hypothetical protein
VRADSLDATVAARASGKAKKPKDTTPVERLAHTRKNYGQASNWDEIEQLIGTAVNKNTKLLPRYVFYEKPVRGALVRCSSSGRMRMIHSKAYLSLDSGKRSSLQNG